MQHGSTQVGISNEDASRRGQETVEQLGGAGEHDVEGARPAADSASISCGRPRRCRRTPAPWCRGLSSRPARRGVSASQASDLGAPRGGDDHADGAVDRVGHSRPPRTGCAGSRSRPGRRPRLDSGARTASGRSASRSRPERRTTRRGRRSRRVAVVGREAEVVLRSCRREPRRGRPQPRPGPATTTARGSPTMVQVACRPRRPTIRHCIGVRSCASSTRTWA